MATEQRYNWGKGSVIKTRGYFEELSLLMRSWYFTSFAPPFKKKELCRDQQNVLLQLVFNYLHMMIPPTPRQVLFVCHLSYASWQIMLTLPSLRSLVMSWTLRKMQRCMLHSSSYLLAHPPPPNIHQLLFAYIWRIGCVLTKIGIKNENIYKWWWINNTLPTILSLQGANIGLAARGHTTGVVRQQKSNWACCFNKSTGDLASLNLC